VPGTRD